VEQWATGWMIRCSSPGRGWELFSSPQRSDRFWGPPSLLSNGYQQLFPWGVKRPGLEADHSLPSSVELKKAWSYTFNPPIRLHCVVLFYAFLISPCVLHVQAI
jgi:hypothetical protein